MPQISDYQILISDFFSLEQNNASKSFVFSLAFQNFFQKAGGVLAFTVHKANAFMDITVSANNKVLKGYNFAPGTGSAGFILSFPGKDNVGHENIKDGINTIKFDLLSPSQGNSITLSDVVIWFQVTV